MDSNDYAHYPSPYIFEIFLQPPEDEQQLLLPIPTPSISEASEEFAEREEEDEAYVVPIVTSPLPWLPPTPSESDPLSSPMVTSTTLSGSATPSNKKPRKGSYKNKSQGTRFTPKYVKDLSDPNLTVKERASIKKSMTCKKQRDKVAAEREHLKAENARLTRENDDLKEKIIRLQDDQRRDKENWDALFPELNFRREVAMQLPEMQCMTFVDDATDLFSKMESL